MLPLKRGASALSSRRGLFTLSSAFSRRFYANRSSSNDNDDNTKPRNVYANLLAGNDRTTNPPSRRRDESSARILDDILNTKPRAAPDQPPRISPVNHIKHARRRVNPAPLIGGLSDSVRAENNSGGILSGSDGEEERLDAASLRAKQAFGAAQDSIAPTHVEYRLYVTARSKNCIITLVDEKSHWRGSTSSGQCGFRNTMEGTYEAGYQCAIRMFNRVREEIERRSEEVRLEIFLNGFGQGRNALLKALTMTEGDGIRDVVFRLTDNTPIRIGGERLQKRRRL